MPIKKRGYRRFLSRPPAKGFRRYGKYKKTKASLIPHERGDGDCNVDTNTTHVEELQVSEVVPVAEAELFKSELKDQDSIINSLPDPGYPQEDVSCLVVDTLLKAEPADQDVELSVPEISQQSLTTLDVGEPSGDILSNVCDSNDHISTPCEEGRSYQESHEASSLPSGIYKIFDNDPTDGQHTFSVVEMHISFSPIKHVIEDGSRQRAEEITSYHSTPKLPSIPTQETSLLCHSLLSDEEVAAVGSRTFLYRVKNEIVELLPRHWACSVKESTLCVNYVPTGDISLVQREIVMAMYPFSSMAHLWQ